MTLFILFWDDFEIKELLVSKRLTLRKKSFGMGDFNQDLFFYVTMMIKKNKTKICCPKMARRWFSRVGLELQSEKIDLTTNTLADAKLNTHRILTDADLPIPGTITGLSPIGAVPNANAASIVGHNLNLQPASGAFGGVVTTGAQTFAGVKTFSSAIVTPGITNPTIDLTAATLADGKLNTHRILTDVDILTVVNEGIAMTLPNPASVLNNTLQTLSFSAMSTASVDGITKTNASTYQLTKKGVYLFQISLVMASASRAAVEMLRDAVSQDIQTSVIAEGIAGITIQHTFNFPFEIAADGTYLITFRGAAEDLPVPGVTSAVTATECAIFHWNNY